MASLATRSEYVKAAIQVLKANGEVDKDKTITVMFNPKEYSLDKSNEFSNINIPGLESPLLQFVRGGLRTLTMDLFFDTYEETEEDKKDVRNFTKKVTDLLKIDDKLHAPPVIRFVWARFDFTAVVKQVNQKFTIFNKDGLPVRATLTVTFHEYRTPFGNKEKKPESSDRTKVYTLTQGDSLWQIAGDEYGDPTLWRHIAKKNEIVNPRVLDVGMEIVIPPLE